MELLCYECPCPAGEQDTPRGRKVPQITCLTRKLDLDSTTKRRRHNSKTGKASEETFLQGDDTHPANPHRERRPTAPTPRSAPGASEAGSSQQKTTGVAGVRRMQNPATAGGAGHGTAPVEDGPSKRQTQGDPLLGGVCPGTRKTRVHTDPSACGRSQQRGSQRPGGASNPDPWPGRDGSHGVVQPRREGHSVQRQRDAGDSPGRVDTAR